MTLTLIPHLHDTAGCQTALTTGLTTGFLSDFCAYKIASIIDLQPQVNIEQMT